MELCSHLRWKSLYGAGFEDLHAVAAVLAHNEVPTHCLRTTRPWGPDDAPATGECCGSHRPCFEPSELMAAEGLGEAPTS
jgi:hypothetical protein